MLSEERRREKEQRERMLKAHHENHVARQRNNVERWSKYQPFHQEWGMQKESCFDSKWRGSKKQHFAYETQGNLIGLKPKSSLREDVGERLGNKFTNWVGVEKYRDTGLLTATEPERIHPRSKYPY